MTIPSGTTSFSFTDIQTELGTNVTGSSVTSFEHAWIRLLANVPSGSMSFSDLRGQTGRFDGNVQMNVASKPVGSPSGVFFGGTFVELLWNSSNQTELDISSTRWTGNIRVRNNSTGASTTVFPQGGGRWTDGGIPANLIRSSQNDNFTICPV